MARLQLTVTVMLLLAAAYLPYAWGVARLLKTDAVAERDETSETIPNRPAPRQSVESSRVAREHLPDVAWAHDAKIQTWEPKEHSYYFYAMQAEQTEEKDAIRFEPVAIVLITKDGPLSIVAEGAMIQFQRRLDPTGGTPGRITQARLDGEVTIRGANNLHVKGRQFFFSEQAARIWSDNPADFAYEQHRGHSDEGVQIDLLMSDVEVAGKQLAIQGLQRVQLLRAVTMELTLPDEQRQTPDPLAIQCAGGFRFEWRADRQSAVATFDDRVKVRRYSNPKQVDGLDCEQLKIDFRAVTENESVRPKSTTSEDLLQRGSLKPRVLEARGQPVVMTSEEHAITATANFVRYDVEQRTLGMTDSDSPMIAGRRLPGSKSKPIHVRHANSELECREVVLKQDDKQQVREVVCRGEGWMTYLNQRSKEPDLVVEWTEQLRKYPDPQSTSDIIDLLGQATVRQPRQEQGLKANYIQLWMEPISMSASQWKSQPRLNPQPQRMLALDRVSLVNPEFQCTTNQLKVWFENVRFDESAGSSSAIKPVRHQAIATKEKPRRSADELVIEPQGKSRRNATESEDDGAEGAPKQPPQPIKVNSKIVLVRIEGRGDDLHPEVAEVWTEGDVRVVQERAPGTKPLSLMAEKLHLKNEGENHQVVHLLGEPAKIDDAAFGLTGNEIFLNRARNVMWVDGAGELNRLIDRDFEGRPLDAPTNMSIHWDEQMLFDGLVARFTGRVHAAVKTSSMKCRQMEVHLRRKISFQEPAVAIEKDLFERVICRHHVEFISQESKQGEDEFRRGRFVEFAMDSKTGEAAGMGPGIVQIWQRGRGKLTGQTPSGVAGANQPMKPRDPGWDYTQVEFNDEMTIKIQQPQKVKTPEGPLLALSPTSTDRTAKFTGQVRVVYGPVDEPMTAFNIDRLPKDAVVLSCDVFNLTQHPARRSNGKTTKPTIEFVAEKNSRLEGRGFNGQADFVTYDGANDLFTLRSLGNNDSMFERESRPGAGGIPVVAKTIRFSRTPPKVEVSDASFAEGVQ